MAGRGNAGSATGGEERPPPKGGGLFQEGAPAGKRPPEKPHRPEPPVTPQPLPAIKAPPKDNKGFETHLQPPPRMPKWYFGHGLHYVADGGASTLTPLFITGALLGDVGQVGLVSAAASMASVPSTIGWTELSDHLHRRKLFILIDYIGTGVLFLLMGLSTTVEQFLGLNIILGVVAAASVSMATMIITETMEARRWTKEIGNYTRVGGLGWILGQLVGAVWLWLGIMFFPHLDPLRILFFIMAALTLAGGAIAWWLVPEPKEKAFAPHHVDKLVVFQGRIVERHRYLPLWIYRRRYHEAMHRIRTSGEMVPGPLRLYLLAALFLFSGFMTVYTPFPVFLSQELDSGAEEIFVLYIVSSVTSAAMYARAGELIPRVGERKVLINVNIVRLFLFCGFGLLALLISSGVAFNHWLLFALLFGMQAAVGFFWAFVSVASTALVSKAAPPATKGMNIGLFNAVVSIGGIAGALVGGAVAKFLGYSAAFFAGVALVALGMVLLAANREVDALTALSSDKEWKEPE